MATDDGLTRVGRGRAGDDRQDLPQRRGEATSEANFGTKGRLMPQARYEPELSATEETILAAMNDDQKLTLAHAIRLAIIEVRNRDLALVKDLLEAWDTEAFHSFEDLFEQARMRLVSFERFKKRKHPDAVTSNEIPDGQSTTTDVRGGQR